MSIDLETVVSLVAFLLISFSASLIGNFATQSSVNDWFLTLTSPPYNPPRWLIPITWTLIYIMIGIAGFLVWQSRNEHDIAPVLAVFGIQLVLNALWPVCFFYLQAIGWAFVEICLLWASVLGFIVLSWSVSQVAAYLFVPYLLWLTYAGYLNLMYWFLNG